MAIVLGLAAALLYGCSDFGGGLASRRLGPLPVYLVGALAAVVLAWAILPLGGAGPSIRAIAWGLAAGIGGGAGTLLLYRGLARGQMSVVGPVSAVGAAVVPVVVGVALGDRPGLLVAVGVLVALPAIALVAASGSVNVSRTALLDGLAAGTAFGLMFVALAQAGGGSGLWPVAAEQTSAFVLVLAIAVATRTPLRLSVRGAVGPILVGVSGMVATLLYFAATQRGMLSTVAILTSLYPGVTVVLARVISKERFAPAQRVGLGLCALAVLAIAVR